MSGAQSKVETRCDPVVGVGEDVKGGGGLDSLPRVSMRGGDAVEVGLGFVVSPPVYKLGRGRFELVFGCPLSEPALE